MNEKNTLITQESTKPKLESVTNDENFVRIKAGHFMMGSDDKDALSHEKPLHRVEIMQDFYICKYQVTMKEYMEFVKQSNSHFPEWSDDEHYSGQNFNDDAPVIDISWEDAKAYCVWRSKKAKKRYQLPTEAQWEYACRAGTTTQYSFGDDEAKLEEYAWYHDNANGKAHCVGDKKPNLWGLYDMHGNVWEYCEDEWSDNYDLTPRDGSANKSGSQSHVIRGGSWNYWAPNCRSSVRYNKNYWVNYVGFRVVFSA